jgi:hypothetical protein
MKKYVVISDGDQVEWYISFFLKENIRNPIEDFYDNFCEPGYQRLIIAETDDPSAIDIRDVKVVELNPPPETKVKIDSWLGNTKGLTND